MNEGYYSGFGVNFVMVEMQRNNTELEEGEAFYCYKDDDDDNIDLDSLSYIIVDGMQACIFILPDERIQHVLGHFRKEFEGGIFPERLGAKFGDYGSFLPTYERSPRWQSCPKDPEKHHSSQKFPSNIHMAAAFYNSKAPSNMPPSMRLGTASHKVLASQDTRVTSVNNTGISLNKVAEKCSLKDDCTNKSKKLTDQRMLISQIKVKSDSLAKKNAEIYSGLGLDDSPSSSTENSHKESEDMPRVSQDSPVESPATIVQVEDVFYFYETLKDMLSSGVLISPLHDSLLYLIRKEKSFRDRRPISSLNGHQEHYSMSTDESDSVAGDSHLLKKRKVTVIDQSEKHHMNGNCSDNDMTLHMKKRLGNRTPDRKDFLSNDLRRTPLSSSICDGEMAEVTGKAIEVFKEVNKNGVECRMVSTEAVKEISLESISDQDFDKIEKQNTGSSFTKKVSADPKNISNCNTSAISKRIKSDEMKYKVDQDTQKCDTNQTKVKSERKNESKGEQGPRKVVTDAEKDIFGTSNNVMVNDRKFTSIGVTSSKSKMHKVKSLKDNKVRDCDRGSPKRKPQRKVDGIDPTDGPPLNKATVNCNLNHVEKNASRVKVKERASGNKVVNQLTAAPCAKDTPGAFPDAENKPTSEMVLSSSAGAPQLIEEDWVCCDICQKWRLLPMGLKPDQLPEKWLCSMLYWLPGMNRCSISEEETTKALYALYQMPIFEGQSNMQIDATGPEIGVKSVDTLQLCPIHKKPSSDVMLDQGRKKQGSNEKAKSGINSDRHQLSNTEKNNAQESVKNRSLNDMNEWPAGSKRMKKSNSQNLSRLNNLIEEKNSHKTKEYRMNGEYANVVVKSVQVTQIRLD
ncbi:unnamed protein product [Sphenostylis stenocarpa]|uniref:CW-type domain-containing protein n=1 Tax=Sphenostylis stenocarpa TaxID=92480 RepID=A0AA86SAJ1_9FABA|nr:unnamed protein product [Sphenostylis stenocarpa]